MNMAALSVKRFIWCFSSGFRLAYKSTARERRERAPKARGTLAKRARASDEVASRLVPSAED